MKNFAFAAALAGVSLVGAAQAADLPRRAAAPAPAPVYAPQTYNWTGAYAGVNGGVDFGSYTKGGKQRFKKGTGGVVGATVGYNYQVAPNVVVGAEADFDGSSINEKRNPAPGVNTKASIKSLASVRGRVGYAADRALVYATAGYAGGDVKTSLTDAPNNYSGSKDSWHNGYVVGGGIEYAFTNQISGKAEYTYTALESKNAFAGADKTKYGADVSQVKAGVNYHF